MSAAAPVRRATQLRGAVALGVPQTAPRRPSALHRPTALPRPRLVLVSAQRTPAGRLPFFIVLGTVLVGGLVTVLMLHMLAAQDAFRVTGLQQRLATLTDQEQQAEQLVAADSSPSALQARAVALGMEPTTITKFQRRPGGRAIGKQTPMYVAPPVTVSARHTARTPGTTKPQTKPKTTVKKAAKNPKSPTSSTSPTPGGKTSPAPKHKPPHHKRGHATR